jgi:hypothetical protein
MQPTYLPWAGYFNLIQQAEVFVFLDDVQFSAQSWQQRNRVVVGGQPHYLTVPVLTKGRAEQEIREVQTDERQNWRKKHLSTLQQAYARHPHGKETVTLVAEVLSSGSTSLAQLNMDLVLAFCGVLKLAPRMAKSSELPVAGRRSAHVLDICRHFAADTFLSAAGSRDYIEEEGILAAGGVTVLYQNFDARPYPQPKVQEFISHMSVVDLLANVGFDGGREYVSQPIC